MRRLLFLILIFTTTAGCGSYFRHEVAVPGRNAGNNAAGMAAAQNYLTPANPEVSDICDVASLEAQRDYYVDRSGSARSQADGDVDVVYITRLNSFDAEVDVAYRTVTQSCRSYARCMQNNFYDEGQCRSNLSSWERARDDFADLSRELREIEAEVDRDRINRRGRYHRGAYINRRERCDCSQSTGGVFANCCDRDSDSAYGRKY